MATNPIEDLQARLREFARARDWEQFHTPKNLAMALSVEAAELLEIFQWLTPEEAQAVDRDADRVAAVRDELADVGIYLLRLADVLDIDLIDAMGTKVEEGERRYPVPLVRGRADFDPDRLE